MLIILPTSPNESPLAALARRLSPPCFSICHALFFILLSNDFFVGITQDMEEVGNASKLAWNLMSSLPEAASLLVLLPPPHPMDCVTFLEYKAAHIVV